MYLEQILTRIIIQQHLLGLMEQQQDQQAQPKISKEDAKRLLEALEADEKKTQEKVQKDKVQAQKAKKMKIEKNW